MKKSKSIIVFLTIIVIILSTLCVLFATGTISFKSNNRCEYANDNIDIEILGTYYFNEDNDDNTYYFKLKSDGTADVVESSCSSGPLPLRTVSYRITSKGNAVILEIDINNDQQYSKVYIGNKVLNRFYQTELGCIGSENSYYEKR